MRLSIRTAGIATAAIAAFVIAPPAASAVTINVDIRTDELVNDSDCSLREAVQSANVDGTGQVEGGCETGSGADNIVLPSGAPYTLTIAVVADGIATGDLEVTDVDGTTFTGAGSATTIIDAGGALGANDRVLDVTSGVGTVGISDVTVQGGLVTTGNGGGILSNASINLSGVRVTGNTTTTGNGGGIQLAAASRTLTLLPGSSVDSNTATVGTGGGIDLGNGGSLSSLSGGSAISSNTAGSSGGGVNLGLGSGTISLNGTTLEDNSALAQGGAISSTTGTALTIDESSFRTNGVSENVVEVAQGGAIHWVGGVGGLQITDTIFDGNTVVGAEAQGGGLNINALAGGVSLTRTAIVNNQATVEDDADGVTFEGGGGIMLSGVSPTTITDSLVAANTATINDPEDVASGAGIRDNGTLTLNRTAVHSNDLSPGVPGGGRFGAGVHGQIPGGPLRVLNSTISNNTLGGAGLGAGIAMNVTSHALTVAHSTFTLNNAGFGDALNISGAGAGFTLRGNVFDEADAANGACFPDGLGATEVNGYNVDAGTSCVDTADDTDLENTDATLGPLVDNGGPLIGGSAMESTRTHELSGPAPVFDLVPPADCEDLSAADLLVDQRGAVRPTDGGCEPGSYEIVRCLGEPAYIGTSGNDVIDASLLTPNAFLGLDGADTITGDGDVNRLCGGADGDVLDGRLGDDQLDGGAATDRASFNNGGAGVTADLATDSATGQGTDQLLNIENLEGSDNPDTLTGDDGVNVLDGRNGGDTITGAGGSDSLFARLGADQIFIRDGVMDTVNCGDGDGDPDTVTTDAPGVDTLTSCDAPDSILFPAVLTPPTNNPPTTTPPGTTPTVTKCKKGQKLKKGKCVKKKKRKKRK